MTVGRGRELAKRTVSKAEDNCQFSNVFLSHVTLYHVLLKAYNQVHTIVSKKSFDFIQL